ncbi:MAG: hypothetical protein PHS92_04130 [Candidatus Gracilibacteria bacterium]|nr:hypothetical protein [Candidatus Gracilibacteria bacterium]
MAEKDLRTNDLGVQSIDTKASQLPDISKLSDSEIRVLSEKLDDPKTLGELQKTMTGPMEQYLNSVDFSKELTPSQKALISAYLKLNSSEAGKKFIDAKLALVNNKASGNTDKDLNGNKEFKKSNTVKNGDGGIQSNQKETVSAHVNLETQITNTNKTSVAINNLLKGENSKEALSEIKNIKILDKADLLKISPLLSEQSIKTIIESINLSDMKIDEKKTLTEFVSKTLPEMKKAAFEGMLKTGFTIENAEDIKYINESGNKDAISLLKEIGGKKIDINNSFIIIDGKITPLMIEGKMSEKIGADNISKINTVKIKEVTKEKAKSLNIDGANINKLIAKLSPNNPFRKILELFAALFGLDKTNEKVADTQKIDENGKKKMVDSMLDQKNSGYDLSKMFDVNGSIKDPKDASGQKYIKDVQYLLDIKDEKTEKSNETGKPDLLTYGEKTKNAVIELQKDLIKNGHLPKEHKVNGNFDMKTALAYQKSLLPKAESKAGQSPETAPKVKAENSKALAINAEFKAKGKKEQQSEKFLKNESTIKRVDNLFKVKTEGNVMNYTIDEKNINKLITDALTNPTIANVKALQKSIGAKADGSFGDKTMKKLESIKEESPKEKTPETKK